jgi:hypothetical protein
MLPYPDTRPFSRVGALYQILVDDGRAVLIGGGAP